MEGKLTGGRAKYAPKRKDLRWKESVSREEGEREKRGRSSQISSVLAGNSANAERNGNSSILANRARIGRDTGSRRKTRER